jgi:hypothetical protein
MYVAVMFGSLTVGSAAWGEIAGLTSASTALLLASLGTLTAIPATWNWKVQASATLDLTPSNHWPQIDAIHEGEPDRGPVLVTVEYCIDVAKARGFLQAMGEFAGERMRDGAYGWQIFEDPAAKGRYLEVFLTDTWSGHLRQHERVTHEDQTREQILRNFNVGDGPTVRHLIAVRSNE